LNTGAAGVAFTWSRNEQVAFTGISNTTYGAYTERWFVMLGFHFAQAVNTGATGQTVAVTCSNGGTFCVMRAEIPM
jgi:hypothetical protein